MSSMKIALTGGPSGGKTTLAQLIEKEFSDSLVVVPEAAAILFKGGFPRGMDNFHVKRQQIAIYAVQRELENIFENHNPGKVLLCDRGSLDCLAYWPGTEQEFFQAINSTWENELARYELVIHLETAWHSYDDSNPVRIETREEALKIDKHIREVWNRHPRKFIIPNTTLFSKKAIQALELFREKICKKT